MAEQKTFRTSFNGFNREDVVHYIEYLNAKHAAEVNELRSEIDFLRANGAQTVTQSAEERQSIEQLEEKLREAISEKYHAEQQRDAALAEKAELEASCHEARQALMLAEEQRDAAQNHTNDLYNRVEQELEAYRRAERTERMAREHAEKVYHQVNSVLADATVKVDDAAATIGELTDMVCTQLSELQSAVEGSKAALTDAAQSMYHIRPSADEE